MSSHSKSKPWQVMMISLLVMISFSGCTSRKEAREEYLDWAIRSICNSFEDVILETSCKALIFFQGDNIKSFIDLNTTDKNYIVYTVYKTSLLGYEVETISFFGNHQVLSVSE